MIKSKKFHDTSSRIVGKSSTSLHRNHRYEVKDYKCFFVNTITYTVFLSNRAQYTTKNGTWYPCFLLILLQIEICAQLGIPHVYVFDRDNMISCTYTRVSVLTIFIIGSGTFSFNLT